MWPTDSQLCDAWRRLAADPDTAGAFAALTLLPLAAYLDRQFPGVDPHAAAEAADTAVLALVRHPTAFDPARGCLAAFLRFVARRDLMNLLDKERRRRRGRIPWVAVELDLPAGNEPEDGESFADHPRLLDAVDGMSEADRRVFELMRDGEKATPVFAAALGVSDLPAGEQADEVKRAKDRVMARLRRAGRGA